MFLQILEMKEVLLALQKQIADLQECQVHFGFKDEVPFQDLEGLQQPDLAAATTLADIAADAVATAVLEAAVAETDLEKPVKELPVVKSLALNACDDEDNPKTSASWNIVAVPRDHKPLFNSGDESDSASSIQEEESDDNN